MGLFGSKLKDNEIEVNLSMVDGIRSIPKGFLVTVGISGDYLTIQKKVGKEEPYRLLLSKITNVSVLTDTEIIEKQKSVGGRAVVGGMLLGPLGAVVGGMSGINSKKKKVAHRYLIINYISIEESVLSFEILDSSFGWLKFHDKLKTLIPTDNLSHEL